MAGGGTRVGAPSPRKEKLVATENGFCLVVTEGTHNEEYHVDETARGTEGKESTAAGTAAGTAAVSAAVVGLWEEHERRMSDDVDAAAAAADAAAAAVDAAAAADATIEDLKEEHERRMGETTQTHKEEVERLASAAAVVAMAGMKEEHARQMDEAARGREEEVERQVREKVEGEDTEHTVY